jgi:hypothetical protein
MGATLVHTRMRAHLDYIRFLRKPSARHNARNHEADKRTRKPQTTHPPHPFPSNLYGLISTRAVVLPWYAEPTTTMSCAPVWVRARRNANSLASEPEFTKYTVSSGAGVRANNASA